MHHYGRSDPLSIAGVPRKRKGGQWSDGRSEGGSNAGRGRHPSRGCDETLRRHDGGRRPHVVDPARQLLRHARAIRLRQDDDAAHDRRVREPHRRPRVPRRLGGHQPSALQARRQHRLSVLRALPAPDASRRTSRFGLERKKVAKAEVNKRVADALELVQLGHLSHRKPGQLSGGQAQRVALARALVNRPRALLLDEPLGALDLRLRKQLQIELKRIQQDIGITFVHVTHDQEEAMTMADTIAVMNGGRIEQAGSATDLYERPRTAFVANFLGVSNLVDARVQRASTTATPRSRPTTAPACYVPSERCGNGADDVRVGVRPEKITLIPADEDVPERRQRPARQGRRRRVPGRLDPVRDPHRRRRGAQRVHAEHRGRRAGLARRRPRRPADLEPGAHVRGRP